MEEKKPNRTIKQLLSEAGLQPTDNDWEKMQAMLDKQLPAGSGKANPFTSWNAWLVAVGVVVTCIVGYLFFKNSSTGKNEMAAHQTEQTQPLNDTNAAKDTVAVLPGKEANGLIFNQQQEEQKNLLNGKGKSDEGTDVNTSDDRRSTSRIQSNNSSTNKTSQPLNEATNIDNQNGTRKPSTPSIVRKERSLEQADKGKLTSDNGNSFSSGIDKDNGTERQKITAADTPIITNQLSGELYSKGQKNDSTITTGRHNDNSGRDVTTKSKTDNISVDRDTVDQRTLSMNSSPAKKQTDSIRSDTKQDNATAKNEAPKDTRINAGKKGVKSNATPGNSGFAVALQLSPLQWNMNNSKKLDFNVAPGIHAQYTFNRVGVGVTIFPFVINSTSRDKFYSRADTTFSSDTFPIHQTITVTDYYTKKITSYKGAFNVSYQLTSKLLFEAGVGLQHLTKIEAERKQSVYRDTLLGAIINSSLQLKGADSLFKQSAQNTSFLYFNIWYTAGNCQFGVGYNQNSKGWFTNTNSKAASQLQFNIRYLLDFRKKK